MAHIFEPFAQERIDARSAFQGTDLGMAIVKKLLDQMNGTISITSREGVGSTFIIEIPFEIAPPPKEKEVNQTISKCDISGRQFMVAEDNELNAEIVTMLLADAEAMVTVVKDGKQALELFESKKPGTFDAIFRDVMMPVMAGLAATKAIRSLQRADAKTIPIIAMMANAFAKDTQDCFNAGMNAHLTKLLDMEQLKNLARAIASPLKAHIIDIGLREDN